MSLIGDEPANYYEVLDVAPDANPAEIRAAYLRIKGTYSKDSVALYSMIDPAERDETLRAIERAYEVLNNPERRREYDRNFEATPETLSSPSIRQDNVVSIDRVPPMESVENAEEMLVAPPTDFGFQSVKAPAQPVIPDLPQMGPSNEIESEIQVETDWSGAFLRKVREARGVSIEEITQATKITRAYILAIEEEAFLKLPAPVYIRGFVSQIARLLRLSVAEVSTAYMKRCQKLCPEKFR